MTEKLGILQKWLEIPTLTGLIHSSYADGRIFFPWQPDIPPLVLGIALPAAGRPVRAAGADKSQANGLMLQDGIHIRFAVRQRKNYNLHKPSKLT